MGRTKHLQGLIRWWTQETGKTQIDMHEVAKFALKKGFQLSKPKSDVDRLAELLSRAARQEYRDSKITGHRYRAYQSVTSAQGGQQTAFWYDTDLIPRRQMDLAAKQRREQMVGDAFHLVQDVKHWNSSHPTEEPIQVELDFEPDMAWRENAPREGEETGEEQSG